MAYENLEPYRDDILALRRPGPAQKTLNEVCDFLFEKHKLRTTPGTLSRYLKDLRQAPGVALREPTDSERERLEAISLLTEVLVEIRGRSDEQRLAIEHLAGQVTINTRAVEELEKAALAKSATGTGQVPPALIRKIWLRAFVVSLLLAAIASGGLYWILRG